MYLYLDYRPAQNKLSKYQFTYQPENHSACISPTTVQCRVLLASLMYVTRTLGDTAQCHPAQYHIQDFSYRVLLFYSFIVIVDFSRYKLCLHKPSMPTIYDRKLKENFQNKVYCKQSLDKHAHLSK